MSAHQNLEHAEHAAHDANHGSGNKVFGVTMALIGVLIALCAARVGSERNELTRSMVKKTEAHSDWTSASTKFRIIMIELEKQRARAVTSAPQIPDPSLKRLFQLATDYMDERRLAEEWDQSYKPMVDTHFDATEGYELAQLVAEIGIVLASLAVLLSNRPAWVLSVIMSVICVFQLGRTFFVTRYEVRKEEAIVEEAKKAFEGLRNRHTGAHEDEDTLKFLSNLLPAVPQPQTRPAKP